MDRTAMYSRGAHQNFYALRLMACTVVALLLVIACFKLPLRQKSLPVGWSNQSLEGSEGINIIENYGAEAGLVTLFDQPGESGIAPTSREELIETIIPLVESDSTALPVNHKLESNKLPVLEYAELMPAIPGGIGAYYVHIEYPEEAIRQGIEGLLLLTFTVNTDGSTSNIQVTQPLHPLCDSAAVQALRRTAFIPGQHKGRSVRVRMRLPVRFELIEPPVESAASRSDLSSEGAPK